jgi:nucleotide-binding universal stress UspA family protein
MGTILAGVDDAPTGRDAAVLACALAAAGDAVLLADVRHDPLLPVHQALRDDDDAANEQFAALAREVARDAAALPVQVRTSTVAARSRARALLGLAEREHATTIVLGSSRRCTAGEAFAGRTARQVLHGAPHAVALATRGLQEQGCELREIVVGIDGSPEGRAALAAAVRLARGAEAAAAAGTAGARAGAGAHVNVHVVAVADDTLPIARTPLGAVGELTRWDEIVAQARALAERLVAEATAADPELTGEVRVGGPPEELAAVAVERAADLLVVGSRHWGPKAAIAIGSTAEELLRGAPCSLLLVPRPAAD